MNRRLKKYFFEEGYDVENPQHIKTASGLRNALERVCFEADQSVLLFDRNVEIISNPDPHWRDGDISIRKKIPKLFLYGINISSYHSPGIKFFTSIDEFLDNHKSASNLAIYEEFKGLGIKITVSNHFATLKTANKKAAHYIVDIKYDEKTPIFLFTLEGTISKGKIKFEDLLSAYQI